METQISVKQGLATTTVLPSSKDQEYRTLCISAQNIKRIKNETRNPVPFERNNPFNAIGVVSVTTKNGKETTFGTGTLIGPKVVLTAAHILAPENQLPIKSKIIRFTPGANGSNAPFGVFRVRKVIIPNDPQQNDYAILLLKKSVKLDTDWFALRADSKETLRKIGDIKLFGYPGYVKDNKTGELRVFDRGRHELWGTHASSDKFYFDSDNGFIFYDEILTTAGQSGSPIFCWDKVSQRYKIVGIHICGDEASDNFLTLGTAVWITKDRIRDISRMTSKKKHSFSNGEPRKRLDKFDLLANQSENQDALMNRSLVICESASEKVQGVAETERNQSKDNLMIPITVVIEGNIPVFKTPERPEAFVDMPPQNSDEQESLIYWDKPQYLATTPKFVREDAPPDVETPHDDETEADSPPAIALEESAPTCQELSADQSIESTLVIEIDIPVVETPQNHSARRDMAPAISDERNLFINDNKKSTWPEMLGWMIEYLLPRAEVPQKKETCIDPISNRISNERSQQMKKEDQSRLVFTIFETNSKGISSRCLLRGIIDEQHSQGIQEMRIDELIVNPLSLSKDDLNHSFSHYSRKQNIGGSIDISQSQEYQDRLFKY